MDSTIIQVYKGELKIGTWSISQGSNIQHRIIKSAINRHPEYYGDSLPKRTMNTKRKGGQVEEYLLNETQTRILFALLLGHPKLSMGLSACIFRHTDSEMHFFKVLEDYLKLKKDSGLHN